MKGMPAFPRQLAEEVRQGVLDNLLSGPATGYPVQDVDILVTRIGREEGRTTPPGCHMAAAWPCAMPGKRRDSGTGTDYARGSQCAG